MQTQQISSSLRILGKPTQSSAQMLLLALQFCSRAYLQTTRSTRHQGQSSLRFHRRRQAPPAAHRWQSCNPASDLHIFWERLGDPEGQISGRKALERGSQKNQQLRSVPPPSACVLRSRWPRSRTPEYPQRRPLRLRPPTLPLSQVPQTSRHRPQKATPRFASAPLRPFARRQWRGGRKMRFRLPLQGCYDRRCCAGLSKTTSQLLRRGQLHSQNSKEDHVAVELHGSPAKAAMMQMVCPTRTAATMIQPAPFFKLAPKSANAAKPVAKPVIISA